jgi:hypothetical protein
MILLIIECIHLYSFIHIPLSQSAHIVENPYIHCILHLFDRSINLYLFHSSIRIDQNKVLREPYLRVAAVEQRQWRRSR